jgi:unsaturated rhamnogalacturonyl hydrolase
MGQLLKVSVRAIAGAVLCFLLVPASTVPAAGQLSSRVADSSVARRPEALVNDSGEPEKWAKVLTNDPKGVGAFLLAGAEVETDAALTEGRGLTVLLDSYFNNEMRKDSTGRLVPWHYKWEEEDNGGYSLWARVFNDYGVKTETLREAPTRANLKGADIYIITDPDTPQESDNPKYVEPPDIEAITDWVRAGGVLVLMGNDKGNAEFEHFNRLAARFGIHFNEDSRNRVPGDDFEMGKIVVSPPNPVFETARNLFLKDICTLTARPPARALVVDKGDVIMATAKFGRGAVFAVGDPWLYNEYTDGRKLPPEYDNFKAAQDLTRWLIRQARAGRK